jgi:hypothetical protein
MVVSRDASLLGSDELAVGAAAHGDEHPVEGVSRRRLRAVERHHEALGPGFDVGHLSLEIDVLVPPGDPLGQRADQVLVRPGNELIHQLGDGDLRAELVVDGGHLQADDPAAQDEQPLRHLTEFQRAGGVDDPRVR